MSEKKWICESEREILSSHAFQVKERLCRPAMAGPGGKQHKFYVLHSRDWGNIIPVTEDGKVVLIRQFRVGIERMTLEIPGGICDPNDKDVKAAAIREMEEETGYSPLPGARCLELATVLSNPAILDNQVHSFIVGPVKKTKEQKLDEAEMIDVVEVPIEEIPELIVTGQIDHALMVLTFLALAFKAPEGSSLLRKQLESFSRV